MKEVSSAPSKVVNVRGMETTAANSESEQGDQLHQRAVRYNITFLIFAVLWPPYVIGQAIYINSSCGFFFFLFFLA